MGYDIHIIGYVYHTGKQLNLVYCNNLKIKIDIFFNFLTCAL